MSAPLFRQLANERLHLFLPDLIQPDAAELRDKMETQVRLHHFGRRRLQQFDHLSLPMLTELTERCPLHRPVVDSIDAGKVSRRFPLHQSLCPELFDRAEQRCSLFPSRGSVSERDIFPPTERPRLTSTANTSFLVTSASHFCLWPADSFPLRGERSTVSRRRSVRIMGFSGIRNLRAVKTMHLGASHCDFSGKWKRIETIQASLAVAPFAQ